jgi:cytochrome d ubiquinol oxidase subunit II
MPAPWKGKDTGLAMAYVPVTLMLAGLAAYTVLAGADFGAGLWTLLAAGPGAAQARAHARHAMGPVWEANHVWLIFVLVVGWTAYPVAFGSIASTLAAPLLIAATGIIVRGAAYALRGSSAGHGAFRGAENLFAVSSVVAPFALGTVAGAIAIGRVPVGNAAGDEVTSWANLPCILVGVLAVAFSGYLAAVYLAADSVRAGSPQLAGLFRRRALAAGIVSGSLALAGLPVLRHYGLELTRPLALAMVCVSAVAGLATLVLCWLSRFGLARLSASLAVAAVVAGWAAAQGPRMLPGVTVTQAAAGRATLIAVVIAVGCGAVVLIPSLALLFTLYLHGRLDTPEAGERTAQEPAPEQPGQEPPARPEPAGAEHLPGGPGPGPGPEPEPGKPGRAGPDPADEPDRPALSASPAMQGVTALSALAAGGGLLVFTDSAWAHAAGVACLIASAVAAFRLVTAADDNS